MRIDLDYDVNSKPRYSQNPHRLLFQLINQGRKHYAARLQAIASIASDFRDVSVTEKGLEPYWLNGFFSPLDAIALTSMIQTYRPAVYLEVGSGNSTRFAKRAVRLYSRGTSIVSIDPQPRAEVDAICDRVIRRPLEELEDFSIFDGLKAGDFLFIDSSHRCFMNSDVAVTFLEILPRLQPGVLVHFHDIFLPWDYPHEWIDRYYSEQYLLACWLLAGDKLQPVLPNMFISRDRDLFGLLDRVWLHVASPQRDGGSFWVVITQESHKSR